MDRFSDGINEKSQTCSQVNCPNADVFSHSVIIFNNLGIWKKTFPMIISWSKKQAGKLAQNHVRFIKFD